jgi:hypothetical protein
VLRRLGLLVAATSLAVVGGVGLATSAGADPNPKSELHSCMGAQQGHHVGWADHRNMGGRNIGGNCPSTLP